MFSTRVHVTSKASSHTLRDRTKIKSSEQQYFPLVSQCSFATLFCTGIDCSVLTPLVRPSSKEAHAELSTSDEAAASSVSTNNPTNNLPFSEECTNSETSYPAESTNRWTRLLMSRQANVQRCSVSSTVGKVVGGGEGGTTGGTSKGNSKQRTGGRSSSLRTTGISWDQANSHRRHVRRGVTQIQHNKKGDLGSVGGASDPTRARSCGTNVGATVRETSGQDGEPLEKNMIQHDGDGLLTSPRLASLDASTLSIRGGIAAYSGCSREDTNKLKVGHNHSAIPASASQIFSLRTRCAVESREASRARQRLFVSLGVGKHRTTAARERPPVPWAPCIPLASSCAVDDA